LGVNTPDNARNRRNMRRWMRQQFFSRETYNGQS